MVNTARFDAIVQQEHRPLNEVDKLQNEIEKIQKVCRHDFRLLEPQKVTESFVPEVFIAHNVYEHSLGKETFPVKCLTCSAEKVLHMTEVCPRCLGKMERGDLQNSRERYFGHGYMYYDVRHYHCARCAFHAVADEWGPMRGK